MTDWTVIIAPGPSFGKTGLETRKGL